MKVQAQRMIGALALTLAAAAALVGAAQAEHPNDRAGALGVGGVAASQTVAVPDVFERAAARGLAGEIVLPNDRAGKLGVGGIESSSQPVPDAFERAALREATQVRPDDRGGLRGPGMVPTVVPTATTASDDGFQWGDATFGAAAVLGFILLGTVAAVTIRRRKRLILH